MTLPALPTPNSITPAEVDGYAEAVERFAADCDDIHEVREARNKWAAITEYIRRTSRDGVARAEAAERRLEQRIGALLGPPTPGRTPGGMSEGSDISRDDRMEFRQMAEHADIVDAVIAASTDASPPTRNKIRTAIRDHKSSEMQTEAKQALLDAGVIITDDPMAKDLARRHTEIVAGLLGRLADMRSYADRFDIEVIAVAVANDRISQSVIEDIRHCAEWLDVVKSLIVIHTTKEQQ